MKEIIKNSPSFIEKPARYIYMSIPDYIRYGKTYRHQYKFLKESQWWTKEKHEEYQMMQVSKLLKHCYENVPYYTRVFNERGLTPKDIQNLNDLKQLPYLTKELMEENSEDLLAKNYNKKDLCYVTTGGSTGVPMGFYIDQKFDKPNEWAFVSNLWNKVGYDISKVNRCVILRGNIPKGNIYEYKGRDLILSSFHLTEDNIKTYIKLIEDFNPDFIQAYPSSISLVCKYIIKNKIKIKLSKTRAILCSSESLYENQRREIEEAFGLRVYSFYGHTEHGCIAGECEKSNYYHIQSEYGYTEIINEKDNVVCEEDEIGEVVVTGFNNYVIPFIRYKTGDLAVNTNESCKCGRNYKLIKRIDGRKQDYFIDLSGNKVTFIYNDVPLCKVKDKISAYQYVQNLKGKIILNIQPKSYLEDYEIKIIHHEFSKYYGNFELKVDIVSKIERTKRGKFRYLIQNLDISNF